MRWSAHSGSRLLRARMGMRSRQGKNDLAKGSTPHTTHHLALDVPCAFGLVRLVKLPSQDVWYDSDITYHIIIFFSRTCTQNSSDSEEVGTEFPLAWAIAACAGIDPLQGYRAYVLSTLDTRISLRCAASRLMSSNHWTLGQRVIHPHLRKHAQIRTLHNTSTALG